MYISPTFWGEMAKVGGDFPPSMRKWGESSPPTFPPLSQPILGYVYSSIKDGKWRKFLYRYTQ